MSVENNKESYIYSCVVELAQHLDELSELPVTCFAHFIRSFLPRLFRSAPIPSSVDDALKLSWADFLRVSCFGFVGGGVVYKLTTSLRRKNEKRIAIDGRSREFEVNNKIAVDLKDVPSGSKFCRCLASKQYPYCDGSHLKLKNKILPLTITTRADDLSMLEPKRLINENQPETSHFIVSSKKYPCKDHSKGESSFDEIFSNTKQQRVESERCMMGESFNVPTKSNNLSHCEDGERPRSESLNTYNSCEHQKWLAKPNEKGERLPSFLLVESSNKKLGDNPPLVLKSDGASHQLSTEVNCNSELTEDGCQKKFNEIESLDGVSESDPEPEFEYVESSESDCF